MFFATSVFTHDNTILMMINSDRKTGDAWWQESNTGKYIYFQQPTQQELLKVVRNAGLACSGNTLKLSPVFLMNELMNQVLLERLTANKNATIWPIPTLGLVNISIVNYTKGSRQKKHDILWHRVKRWVGSCFKTWFLERKKLKQLI